MPYTKHTWVDGEVITAAKLNNIEEGIEEAEEYMPAPSAFIVNAIVDIGSEDERSIRLDKTWQEIYNAFLAGPVWIAFSDVESVEEYDENDQPITVTNSYYNIDIVDCVLSEQASISPSGIWYYLVTAADSHLGTFSENGYPSDSLEDGGGGDVF